MMHGTYWIASRESHYADYRDIVEGPRFVFYGSIIIRNVAGFGVNWLFNDIDR